MKCRHRSFRHTPLYTALLCAFALGGSLGFRYPAYAVPAMTVTPPGETEIYTQDRNGAIGATIQVDSTGASFAESMAYGDDITDEHRDTRYIWLKDRISDKPALNVTVSGRQNNVEDAWGRNPPNVTWLFGAFNSLPYHNPDDSSVTHQPEDTAGLTSADLDGRFSGFHDGAIVNLKLDDNSRFAAKIFGSRNDIGGGTDLENYETGAGNASNNTVNIALGSESSQLYAKLIFGGRSAQMENINKTGSSHPGFETNGNRISIDGGTEGLSFDDPYSTSGTGRAGTNPFTSDGKITDTASFIVAKGIFGAEGYEAGNNLVQVSNAVIVSGKADGRKLGLVGGRGMMDMRVGKEAVECKNDSCRKYTYTGKDGQTYTHSSIANNNIVTVKDSYIGYALPDGNTGLANRNEWNNSASTWDYGFSVYGGWSTGEAKNNIVSVENSIVNGNVIGGLEFQNIIASDAGNMRELDANLVSLHNVTLVGKSAVYGTATANGSYQADSNRLDESSIKAVNRRRGIAYIAGENTIGSAYVRYIHFGQYYDVDKLNPGESINVTQEFYPHAQKGNVDTNESDNPALVRIREGDEAITLNQQVAGSFLINTSGFHSSLAQKTADQSDQTNGKHNFWVGAYTNLAGRVEGDGRSLDTKTRLFQSDEKTVNHYYGQNGDEQLSLLAHDDGMVFDTRKIDGTENTHTDALMHQFRYHYDGRVLYLGVNNGKDADGQEINAVAIDFKDIEAYRQATGQGTNAFGNTQIGIFMNADRNSFHAGTPIENGDTSTSLKDMTFDIDGFEIRQGGQQVATATYGFYKYMHFDGTDQEITIPYYNGGTEDVTGKATDKGEEGGVGIKYWLKSVDVLPGRQLALYGAKEADLNNPDIKESAYTLSARVTGKGGVYIPEGNTVIMGDENSIYLNPTYNPDWASWRNTYTGETTVDTSAVVQQGADHALGNTRNLDMADGSTYRLNGKIQTIGGLQQANGSAIEFDAQPSATPDGSTDKSGHLTIDGGWSQNPDGVALAVVSGNLEGNQNAVLDTVHTDLTINSGNEGYQGTVNLTQQTVARLENARALESATTTVDAGSRLYLNGAEAGVPNQYGNSNTHYLNNLKNAGAVYLSRQDNASVGTVNTVQIQGDYTGQGGTLVYHTQLNGDNDSPTDFVEVKGTASGTGKVAVNALPGSNGARTDKGIHILHADDTSEDFTLTEGGPIVGGAYYYGLEGRDEDAKAGKENWYLVNTGEVRAEAGGYIDNSLAWAEMHMRLHDRMGQAYYRDPFTAEVKETAGWGRIVGNHTHFQMGNGISKTHSETEIIQVGSDIFRKRIEESDWKYNLGVFGGYLNNRSQTRSRYSAKSKVDGHALGVYGTLYTGNSPDDGFYLDSWLMWGNYDNEVYGSMPKFSYDADGWVASLEVGQTLPIGETGEKGIDRTVWTLQPQAQVIWDGMKADRVEDSSHTVYRQLGGDNVILRLGSRLHANFENKGLGFLELNWIHNTKKRGVWMNGDRTYQDGSRDSGEIRVGAEGYLEKNTLGWVTLGVRAGSHGYHEESAQIGVKYLF